MVMQIIDRGIREPQGLDLTDGRLSASLQPGPNVDLDRLHVGITAIENGT
jgi:hypothetical protein